MGSVKIGLLLLQHLHHFDMTKLSSPAESATATNLKGSREGSNTICSINETVVREQKKDENGCEIDKRRRKEI
jgi:hypothetical protein